MATGHGKKSLIDFGFRLPSAYDNRPLTFDEFHSRIGQTIYVSATPADYERERASQIAEQVIRPHRAARPGGLRPPNRGADRRSHRRDQRDDGEGRADARHDADEEKWPRT